MTEVGRSSNSEIPLRAGTTGWTFQFVIAASCLAVLFAFAMLFRFGGDAYRKALRIYINWPGDGLFMDWNVTPKAIQCARQGVFVYVPNPCMGLFNYSPLWLKFPAPPGSPTGIAVGGVLIAVLFLLALTVLTPRPRSTEEFVIRLLATISGSVALGIERGNVDLLLFVAVLAGVFLQRRRGIAAALGYGLMIFGGLLKFYPMFALYFALRERVATLALIFAAAVAASLWLFLSYRAELAVVFAHLPGTSDVLMQFGAADLPHYLSGRVARALGAPEPAVTAFLTGLALLATFAGSVLLARAGAAHELALPSSDAVRAPLVACAAIVLFCFLTGQNYVYRCIYLLPALPGFFAMRAATPSPRARQALLAACGLIALLMWMPTIHFFADHLLFSRVRASLMLVVLGYELAWFVVASLLGAVLLAFLIDSPLWHALTGRRRPAPEPNPRRSGIGDASPR